MRKKEVIDLLEKYEQGTLDEKGIAMLESWYNHRANSGQATITDEELEHNLDKIWTGLNVQQPKTIRIWPRLAIAASIVLCIGLGFYFYRSASNSDIKKPQLAAQAIVPGGNKAILTLANGNTINLSDANDGKLAEQAGVRITKTNDGQLVYKVTNTDSLATTSAKGEEKVVFNTISTPRGGKYQINLPDGSKIWLNAASSLKFPSCFTHKGDRRVELTGEAYFEVAKNKEQPFIVTTNKQKVEVLGTHFNISGYTDEGSTITTLLEGSVRVGSNKVQHEPGTRLAVLKPGQRSVLHGEKITVEDADIEEAVAWKNGNFIFNDEGLESIMRKIARWYDVDVHYQDRPTEMSFIGAISRSKNLTSVLNILSSTGKVHFKVEGRRVIVMK